MGCSKTSSERLPMVLPGLLFASASSSAPAAAPALSRHPSRPSTSVGPAIPPLALPPSRSASPVRSLACHRLQSCHLSPDRWSATALSSSVPASVCHWSWSLRPSPYHQLTTARSTAVVAAACTASPSRSGAARSSSTVHSRVAFRDSRPPSPTRSASACETLSSDRHSYAHSSSRPVLSGHSHSGSSSVSSR